MNLQTAKQQWHPVAASTDLVARHVFHAQLCGRELAVWRADDGHVNVWENRCLHRGVRLSIGINDGRELVCQYHGWRYANRTAGCTYIPAHPADAPARTICNNQYPVIEQHGLIWSCDTQNQPQFAGIDLLAGAQLVLRALPMNTTTGIIGKLLTTYNSQQAEITLLQQTDFALCLLMQEQDTRLQINFFCQPVDSNRTVVRGILSGLDRNMKQTDKLQLLRRHNTLLGELRELAEHEMRLHEAPQPWVVNIKPVAESLAYMPEASTTTDALLRVKVEKIQDTANAIKSVELVPLSDQLPTFHAGAHIDVHLPNGLVRQYSLTNATGQTDRYVIGVKREPQSTGGSSYIHDTLKVDDVIAVSVPRNNFPLRRDAVKTLLIAGGIGITPLLSMAQALHHSSLPFELHYFIQGDDHRAYPEILKLLQTSLTVHTALSPQQTQARLHTILAQHRTAHHVYVCGPPPMLDATRVIAEQHQWPDDSIHFEYFKNTTAPDHSVPFTVNLARSGLTLQVPSGKSLLEVLRDNSVNLPSSCEQGACGTCRVTVTEGEPLHQDVYLSHSEQQRGDCMMTCVSRAKTDSLTIDI